MARYPRDLQSYVITRLPRVHPHMETTHHHRGSRAWFCINFTSRNTSRLDDDNDLLRHPLRARDAINLYFTGAKGLAASPIILHILEEGRGVTIQRFEIVGMDDDDGRFVPGNGIGENLENKEQGRWNLVRFSRVFWQLLPRVLSGYTRQLAIKCISTLLISSRSHLWGCAHGHGGLRSRARWVCLVSFFTRIGHVAEAHEVRTSLSLALFLFRLFLSSLDWHFKPEQRPRRGENGRGERPPHSCPRNPRRRPGCVQRRTCARHVAGNNKIDHDFTIDRSNLPRFETTASRTGRGPERDYPFLWSNRIIISSPSSTRLFPHFIFPVSLFSCLASRSINRSHL